MPGCTREDQVSALQVSCLCALVVDAGELAASPERAQRAVADAEIHTYWRDEDPNNLGWAEGFLRLLDECCLHVAYNGANFDMLVMSKHYSSHSRRVAHAFKLHDPFSRLRDVTGGWFKLDDLLKTNGLDSKTANGLQAITFWEQGRRHDLEAYCAADVRLMAQLVSLPELLLPGKRVVVPNHVFGVASALAAVKHSETLRTRKRPFADTDGNS